MRQTDVITDARIRRVMRLPRAGHGRFGPLEATAHHKGSDPEPPAQALTGA